MTSTDYIALVAALAGWVALYFQWRSTRATDKDLDIRLHFVQDVLQKLKTETETRERQIKERQISELRLSGQDTFSEMDVDNTHNQLVLLEQIILFQASGLAFLAHRDRVLEQAPTFTKHFDAFNVAVIAYISRSHYQRAFRLQNPEAIDDDDIQELNNRIDGVTDAYKLAVDAGLAMMRELEAIKFASYTGSDLEESIRPFREVLRSADKMKAKLRETAEMLDALQKT